MMYNVLICGGLGQCRLELVPAQKGTRKFDTHGTGGRGYGGGEQELFGTPWYMEPGFGSLVEIDQLGRED